MLNQLNLAVRAMAAGFLTMLVVGPATAQDAPIEKPRLAIRDITPSGPVLDAARMQGQSQALAQIVAAADSQLLQAINDTRRFDLVARSDLATVLREQDMVDSGLVDPADPQAARAFAMAGARYVATVSIDNFQDATAVAEFGGGLGETTMERRTIQMMATLKIFDITSGVLLDSASLRIEDAQVTETLPGARQTGRLSNELLGRVAEHLARETANAIMNRLTPARVLALTFGQITLNRGAGTGIEVGQVWRVYDRGRSLVDPDTGEVLGNEEIPVGWARITEVGARLSKAEAIEDLGINEGAVLRYAEQGLPRDVNPAGRATGSATGSDRGSATPQRLSGGAGNGGFERAPAGGDREDERPFDADRPVRRVAVFVRDTAPGVPDRYTDTLESLVTAAVAGPGIEVIARSLVLDAVSDLSSDGANRSSTDRGGGDAAAGAAAGLLSDQTSALSLARTLGADALLVATVADLSESSRRFRDDSLRLETDITETTLTMVWTLVSGDTGGAVASGRAEPMGRTRSSNNFSSSGVDLGGLLRDGASQIGREVRAALSSGALRPVEPAAGEVGIEVRLAMEGLSVPDIRRIDGAWVVTGDRLAIQPEGADLLIDGFLTGSAPGLVSVAPGPHRLRIEAPGLEPVDRFIVARDGMALTVPMRLSEQGRRNWMEQAAFLETLRNGAALRENEGKLVEGLAEFLRGSRLNLDTSALESISVTPESVSLWSTLLGR